MQVEDGIIIETHLDSLLHQKLYGGFMVQDHLRLQRILAFGSLPQLQQEFGFEQRVSIAFQTTGVPG